MCSISAYFFGSFSVFCFVPNPFRYTFVLLFRALDLYFNPFLSLIPEGAFVRFFFRFLVPSFPTCLPAFFFAVRSSLHRSCSFRMCVVITALATIVGSANLIVCQAIFFFSFLCFPQTISSGVFCASFSFILACRYLHRWVRVCARFFFLFFGFLYCAVCFPLMILHCSPTTFGRVLPNSLSAAWRNAYRPAGR